MDLANRGMVCINHFIFNRLFSLNIINIFLDEKSKDTKKTSSSETILHGLKKYTNYSMQVLAYTSGGDGVRSIPIHCKTEQDGIFLILSLLLLFNNFI